MKTNSIDHLYNEFRLASEYPPDYTIEFFNRNNLFFNSIKTIQDGNELKLYIEMTWQYLQALYKKNRYYDMADVAIRHLQIIDKEIEHLKLSSIKDNWYYGIIFLNGMANYQLKDYKMSKSIFKQLIEHDPSNKNYKGWLSHSIYGQRMWISKTITIVCGILILVEFFFKKYISPISGIAIDVIAITGIITTFIYDYYIKRDIRRIKQT